MKKRRSTYSKNINIKCNKLGTKCNLAVIERQIRQPTGKERGGDRS